MVDWFASEPFFKLAYIHVFPFAIRVKLLNGNLSHSRPENKSTWISLNRQKSFVSQRTVVNASNLIRDCQATEKISRWKVGLMANIH